VGNEVFANGNEIACKGGDGKVIAAFPDVCMSPPSPPAGPIPIPYPNTSFSKDTKNGSKTVKIDGNEIMLKDKSFYKTSPLGNEAATRSFGASVVSHVITGKTYFVAWSMDVKVEGLNVDRHIDLTTSNHASPMGSTPPNPNLEALEMGALEDVENECGCCGAKPKHSEGAAMTFDEWFGLDKPGNEARKTQVEAAKARKAAGCCKGKLFPEKPCNVFRAPVTKREHRKIVNAHKRNAPSYRQSKGMPAKRGDIAAIFPGLSQHDEEQVVKVNHRTPKNAGGCPTGPENLQMHWDLCQACQDDDDDFGNWGGEDHPTVLG